MTTTEENDMDYWATVQPSPYAGAADATTPPSSAGRVVGLVLLILATIPPTLAVMVHPLFVIPAALLGAGLVLAKGSKARVACFVLAAVTDIAFYAVLALFIYAMSHLQF
jgi:hypothetical protein